VGDTILIPVNVYASLSGHVFSRESVNPRLLAISAAPAEYDLDKEMNRHDKPAKIDCQAGEELKLLRAMTSSSPMVKAGDTRHEILAALQATAPGRFNLTIETDAAKRLPSPVPMTIVSKDSPVTVLAPGNDTERVYWPPVLRVGDKLLLNCWAYNTTKEQGNPDAPSVKLKKDKFDFRWPYGIDPAPAATTMPGTGPVSQPASPSTSSGQTQPVGADK
jgi:hypothetical protein